MAVPGYRRRKHVAKNTYFLFLFLIPFFDDEQLLVRLLPAKVDVRRIGAPLTTGATTTTAATSASTPAADSCRMGEGRGG